MLGAQFKEALAAQRELAVAVGIGEEAQDIGHRQALLAGAVALAAHAAIERANGIQMRGQDFFVARGEGIRHSREIFVQLIHVRDAGNGGGNARLLDDPLEGREHGAFLGQTLQIRIAGLQTVRSTGHHLHGYHPHAGFGGGFNGLIHAGVHGEVVGSQHHIKDALLHHPGQQLLLAAVCADADEADFALFFGLQLHFDLVVGNLVGAVAGVEIPDVDVIGVEFAQAGFEMLLQLFLVGGVRLGGDDDLLAASAES